jgi:syntaxin 5
VCFLLRRRLPPPLLFAPTCSHSSLCRQVARGPAAGHQLDDVALSIDLTQAQEHDPILGRAEEVERITGVLHEVGQMWTTISSLVAEQDNTIQRIDFDLDNTDSNLQRAHTEVEILWNTVHSNRYLFMKVFAVLIVFIIMFVVFFV